MLVFPCVDPLIDGINLGDHDPNFSIRRVSNCSVYLRLCSWTNKKNQVWSLDDQHGSMCEILYPDERRIIRCTVLMVGDARDAMAGR